MPPTGLQPLKKAFDRICHPDRSGPDFSCAQFFRAPGRV